MSNTCYIFSTLFLFHCFNPAATIFTFTSETSVILPSLKCLHSKATTKLLVKNAELKLEVFFDNVRRDVQLGHFILLSVPTSQQLSRLTPLYFSCDRWNLTTLFVDNSQVLLNKKPLLKSENSSASNNL